MSGSLVSLLVEAGVASEVELGQVAAEADAQGIGLGELVVARGLLDEEGMARLVAGQWGLPFLARGSLTMDPAAAGLLAFEQASRLGGCVIGIRGRNPLVAVADPSAERLDALRAQVEGAASVSFAVVTASSLKGLLGQLGRLNGRRANPNSGRSSRAGTTAPAAGKHAEPIASQSASSGQRLVDLERAAATEQALRARLGQLEREQAATNQQIEQLQQQLQAADQQRVSERDHDSEVQVRLDQLDSERGAAYQQIDQLHQQIEPLQQQIEQLQRQLETINRQRASERDNVSQLQANLDQLESERDAANQQIEQLQQQLQAADKQRVSEHDHGSQLQALLDQLESERDAANQQIEQLQQQLQAADEELASEHDHAGQLQASLDQLERDHTAAEQQIEQLQQQLATIDQQRASEHDHASQLQTSLDQFELDRAAAEQQIAQLQEQLVAADRQRVSERDHASQLQASLDQLESERDAANQQIARLQEQLVAADQQRVSERDHASQLQALLDTQHTHVDHLEHQDRELRRQIHELLTRPDSSNPTTTEEIAAEVPLIDLRLLEGVFSQDERRQLAKGLMAAVVGVKGESFRDQTEVLIAEVPAGCRDTPDEADTLR